MSFETAEPAIAEHPSEHAFQGGASTCVEEAAQSTVGLRAREDEKAPCPPRARGASSFSTVSIPLRRGWLATTHARLGSERMAALRDVWLSVWSSRLLVWIAG